MTDPPTVVVTGATDGLGRALARRLADDGLRLVLHGRHEARVASVADDIARATGAERPRTVVADLAVLAEVARLGAELRETPVDVLVNNAGIGSGVPDGRERRTSADGHELRFAVNYLSGFLLTELLADHLRAVRGPACRRASSMSPRSASSTSTSATSCSSAGTRAPAPTPRASSPRSWAGWSWQAVSRPRS